MALSCFMRSESWPSNPSRRCRQEKVVTVVRTERAAEISKEMFKRKGSRPVVIAMCLSINSPIRLLAPRAVAVRFHAFVATTCFTCTDVPNSQVHDWLGMNALDHDECGKACTTVAMKRCWIGTGKSLASGYSKFMELDNEVKSTDLVTNVGVLSLHVLVLEDSSQCGWFHQEWR